MKSCVPLSRSKQLELQWGESSMYKRQCPFISLKNMHAHKSSSFFYLELTFSLWCYAWWLSTEQWVPHLQASLNSCAASKNPDLFLKINGLLQPPSWIWTKTNAFTKKTPIRDKHVLPQLMEKNGTISSSLIQSEPLSATNRSRQNCWCADTEDVTPMLTQCQTPSAKSQTLVIVWTTISDKLILPRRYFLSAETEVVTPTLTQCRPPSTKTQSPVVKRDMSDARNAMVLAISSGWAIPPSGCFLPWASTNWNNHNNNMIWLWFFFY